MKMLMYSTLGVLLLAGSAVAQPKKAAGEDVAATLKALEEKWVQAQLKGDAAALGSVLAEGFVSTTSTGELRTKAETLDMVKSGALKLQSSKLDEMRVMVFGDAAVVIGRWQGKGTEKGKPLDDTERFTDTWIKQGGQWRCVASQGTLVKKK